jgi:hypothetical protein
LSLLGVSLSKLRKGKSTVPTFCAYNSGVEIDDQKPIVIIKKVTINFAIILYFLLTNIK